MLTKRELLGSAAVAAFTSATVRPSVVLAQTEWPNVFEAKDIAEEGFVYGLPLVMIYAVMQEFAVNRNSGQFKAPFNDIKKHAPRRHTGGHGGHHPEQ